MIIKKQKIKPDTIWIDADSCPKAVKEMVFKTSQRLKISVVLVANSYQNIPCSDFIRMIVVKNGFDAADEHIIAEVKAYDLVITADIPLAAKVLEKKAVALNPRGKIYTLHNISAILSMRNILKEFYEAGTIGGGTPPFGAKELKEFANSLNQLTCNCS